MVDSTGGVRPVRRPPSARTGGWAEYGFCASHSRYFWGLRLHLVCTLQGLPVAFALAGAKADEREVLAGMLTAGPDLVTARPGQTLIGDKNYFGAAFEATIADAGIKLLRPARKGEPAGQGRTCSGRCARSSSRSMRPSKATTSSNTVAHPWRGDVRVLQRILAMTTAIWQKDKKGKKVMR